MDKIEHIGIAVKDLEAANQLFQKLLGRAPYKEEEVPSEGVRTSFFRAGPNKVELLADSGEGGPIGKFLERKGEGIHHVAFAVEDIGKEIKRLEGEGFRVLQPAPRRGADNKLVAFLHPKDSSGVLVELCQEIVE